MRTLYVTDLDGTLLNRQDRISKHSVRIIKDLVEAGMLFTYATARSLSSASVVAAGLPAGIPVIVYNGAFILRPDTGEVLHAVSFTPGEAAKIREILETHDISPLVYSLVDGEERVSLDTCNLNAGKQRYLDSRKNDRRLRPLH